jgi:hypothetical protein
MWAKMLVANPKPQSKIPGRIRTHQVYLKMCILDRKNDFSLQMMDSREMSVETHLASI